MTYYTVNVGMSLASLCFVIGFMNRFRIRIHRIWMSLGVFFVFASAVGLVVSIHVLYGGDRVAAGFIQQAPDTWILAHRLLAVFSVIVMIFMVITGINKNRKLHVFASRFFMVSYIVVYISGLFLFQTS